MIIYLTIKSCWYKLIAAGTKREEYREVKPFYEQRIGNHLSEIDSVAFLIPGRRSGWAIYQVTNITVGIGNPDWGAPNYPVYILHLGKRIK